MKDNLFRPESSCETIIEVTTEDREIIMGQAAVCIKGREIIISSTCSLEKHKGTYIYIYIYLIINLSEKFHCIS